MTGDLSLAGQLVAMAFASGLNLYATVAVLGLTSRLGWIPALPPGLRGLEDVVVIASAALLFLVEFVVDKVPHLDSLWDTIHTFIRPSAATLLALAAVDGSPWTVRAGTAVLAGGVALTAHGTKAGLRLAINAAPGRLATTGVSLAEDAVAIVLAIAALTYPAAALGIAAATLALAALFGPRLWRAFVLGIRALAARLRGFFGRATWHDIEEVPRALRALVTPPDLGAAAPRAIRATLSAPRPVGAFRNGWLVVSDAGPFFLYRAFLRPRSVSIGRPHELSIRRGVWADTLEIETERFRCTLFALKDGPGADLILADFASDES